MTNGKTQAKPFVDRAPPEIEVEGLTDEQQAEITRAMTNDDIGRARAAAEKWRRAYADADGLAPAIIVLADHINALADEVVRLRGIEASLDRYKALSARYRDGLEEAHAENTALREALEPFTHDHAYRCDFWIRKPCDCGLDHRKALLATPNERAETLMAVVEAAKRIMNRALKNVTMEGRTWLGIDRGTREGRTIHEDLDALAIALDDTLANLEKTDEVVKEAPDTQEE